MVPKKSFKKLITVFTKLFLEVPQSTVEIKNLLKFYWGWDAKGRPYRKSVFFPSSFPGKFCENKNLPQLLETLIFKKNSLQIFLN